MSGEGSLQLTWDGVPGEDYNIRYWKLEDKKQYLTVRNRSRAVIPLPAGDNMVWNIQVRWKMFSRKNTEYKILYRVIVWPKCSDHGLLSNIQVTQCYPM